ncbi:50S ribosomal protein L10 [Treponema socranskii]|uniref:Large ribosomal subunit protein uL10 n=1 Tax=Treponema socranskii subsp. socranskii VPI DR56BR1116 = ATCC 35536 TaxID=1125725 RepID=U2MEK5_TRESO|nr:50S ribosomal protein L10 [Treponema socranskii]ERF60320.1 ribosomal protein L10 [Treponema socranskii subsp. socranskii VPI DR56BR1116 = ATCC 35536]ERJ97748.1 ribosomal protein L10 [Treponema socranskii subsp. socranskii VPI DR56BR1116 = ATCC 35536]MDR9859765.1 50S ribosomal protein L10 [Treponema socranskii]
MAVKAKKIQPAKTAAIEAAKKTFADYNDFIFADYRGMTVEQITQLRRKLREQSAVLKVVKNNFARIAFADMKIDNVADYLKGPTVVAMVKEDSNEVAKTLFDFTKDAPTLNVKGGFIGKEIYDAAKISEFSKIPGKKTLIAMLMSAINGPARQLAATLQAYVDKKAAGGDVSPDAPKSAAAAETPKAEEAPAAAAEAPKADAAPASEAPKADAAPAEKPAEGTAEAPKADAAPEA